MEGSVIYINDRLERGRRDQERLTNALRRVLCKLDSALEIFQDGDHKSTTASKVVNDLQQTRLRLLATLQKI